MTEREKKDAVLKWLSLSQYRKTDQSLDFICRGLKKKYPELRYDGWRNDLQNILLELETARIPFIGKAEHEVSTPRKFGDHIGLTKTKEYHYFTTLDGDGWVQDLPNLDRRINNDAVIELINLLLKYLPLGVFDQHMLIEYLVPKSSDLIFTIIANDDTILAKVIAYLITTGFCTQRLDVAYQNKLWVELSEKGKKLKELGSVEAYYLWIEEEKERVKKIELDNEILRQTSIDNAKNQAILNPLMIKANEDTLLTNENIRATNTNIQETNANIRTSNTSLKSIFRWTLIVAGLGLAISAINTYETFRKDALSDQLKKSDSLLQLKMLENAQLKKSLDSLYREP